MNCAAVIVGKNNMKTAALVLGGNTLKEDNLENIYLEKDVYSNWAVGIFESLVRVLKKKRGLPRLRPW